MAANTAVSITLNARDWEAVIGIIDNSAEPDLRKLKIDLVNYYEANGNPQGTTPVIIASKEKTVVKIFQAFYGNTIRYLVNDTGGSTFNRVIAALRLLNNIADNYINTQLAAEDAARAAMQISIRKNGREVLMMENFDNN